MREGEEGEEGGGRGGRGANRGNSFFLLRGREGMGEEGTDEGFRV
jgi:hypothetical protein